MGVSDRRRVELSPDRYDDRWRALAAAGQDIHGEAALIEALLPARGRILDAGCGTGRVAIELARRGFETVGVDVDRSLLDAARVKAPHLTWIEADLACLDDAAVGPFDAIVMAGNVMIFVAPGTEGAVIANLATRLAPGGRLVAGFQLVASRMTVATYDEHAVAAGLHPVAHWSTWDRQPCSADDSYVVAVHSLGFSNR
ncbi:MAG TPA: class I SAM-dependent methyltransferase [Acidimicrobiia bacterium]